MALAAVQPSDMLSFGIDWLLGVSLLRVTLNPATRRVCVHFNDLQYTLIAPPWAQGRHLGLAAILKRLIMFLWCSLACHNVTLGCYYQPQSSHWCWYHALWQGVARVGNRGGQAIDSREHRSSG